jgi:hypothetical protein
VVIAMTRLLESRALDGVQGWVEQPALLLDVTAHECGELQLRIAQVDTDAVELTSSVATGWCGRDHRADDPPRPACGRGGRV